MSGYVCPRCGKRFTTVQGLGMHWRYAKRKPAVCPKRKDGPINPERAPKLIQARVPLKQHLAERSSVKDDTEKPRLDLLPPRALLSVGKVMTYGAAKYGEDNYLNGAGIEPTRLVAATLRHLVAAMADESIDSESGLPHLAHAAASVMMALEVIERRKVKS